ncbi:PQQ-dependent sugar dehydrogenase, partial [Singulisphaera rosea]
VPESEVVLLEGDDQSKLGGVVPAGHQGGGLHFGSDGKLYVAIGEQTAGDPSQRLDTYLGKLLRINRDGSIPEDNPFFHEAKGKYRAIWAYGLRNPFGFAVQPGTGRIFINDVGGSRWEEIDEGVAGANYGWPVTEGPTKHPGHHPPIHSYGEAAIKSLSGGVFYNPPHRQFPDQYVGKYFFADFILNWVRVLDPERPDSVQPFASGLAGPVALQVGPDGSLYCLNRNAWVKDNVFKSGTGTLHKIRYESRSRALAPGLISQAKDVAAVVGSSATFRVEADGTGPLEFRWQKDGRTIAGADKSTYTLDDATTEDEGAQFQCVVSNAEGTIRSRPGTLRLSKRHAPAAPLPMLAGLECEVHEGRWTAMPTFDHETRVGSGTSSQFVDKARTRDKDFGLSFRGYLEVDRPGAYTFHLDSSGASKLYVASAEVATTTMTKGPRRSSGTVGLDAGRHPIRLDHAHGDGRPHLELWYSGAEVEPQTIPPEKLFRLDRTKPVAPTIQPEGGSYSGPISVSIATPTTRGQIRYTLGGSPPTANSPLVNGPVTITSSTTLVAGLFAEGAESPVATTRATFQIKGGEPYGLPLRPLASTTTVARRPEEMPQWLSQTGLFRSLEDLTPQPGVIPYTVNSPLWSDGAYKSRWIVLPGDARIAFSESGPWSFPEGTILVKHFEFGDPQGVSVQRRRLETRVLVVTGPGQGFGVSYKWRPDQRDASLMVDGAIEPIPAGPANAGHARTWTYPSQKDCMICHTTQAGFVLGVNTRQLNGPYRYPASSTVDNQIRAWSHAGLFETPVAEDSLAKLDRLVDVSDSSAPLEHRVRSYLDVNCAQCHRPGGVRSDFDSRFEVPTAELKMVSGPLLTGDLGVPNSRVVAPGDRTRSMLFRRMGRREDVYNMPPLGSQYVDPAALDAVGRWIDSLDDRASSPSARVPSNHQQQ